MTKILFVCLGNICRSPMAEYIMRDLAKQRALEIATDSAGTSGWHDGENMHCGTAEVLDGLGIESSGFQSRKVEAADFQRFDYVVAMDQDNLANLKQAFGAHEGQLFVITDLVPELGYDGVPDPWYTGRFDEVRDLLLKACTALLDKIEAEES